MHRGEEALVTVSEGPALYRTAESSKSVVFNLGLKTRARPPPGRCPPGSRRGDPQAQPVPGIAPSQARFRWILNGALHGA